MTAFHEGERRQPVSRDSLASLDEFIFGDGRAVELPNAADRGSRCSLRRLIRALDRHMGASMKPDIPGRVFLDTCVVNFMLDFGAQIHDGASLPTVPPREAADIDALRNLFVVGQRAMWQLAVSPYTYSEIARTRDGERLGHLHVWFQELWQCWRTTIEQNDDLPSFIEAEDVRIRPLISAYLSCLPDVADRVLISDALVYHCELFCTRDWTTILKHRTALSGLPIEIVTPAEWWAKIRPYAGLWA